MRKYYSMYNIFGLECPKFDREQTIHVLATMKPSLLCVSMTSFVVL